MNRFAIILNLLMVSMGMAAWDWSFPKDHGMHPTFDSEWVYITGHLTDQHNTLHGFQVTFFRHKLTPVPNGASPWNSPHLYTAHFAFTNGETKAFNHFETMGRERLPEVYGDKKTMAVAIHDWTINMKDDRIHIDIKLASGQFKLDLGSNKPMVFHGNNGKSYKSNQGNYSYYYSMTRLMGTGQYKTNDTVYQFKSASAWMDREFFNHLLGDDQDGWDWFSLQLDSGEDIMVFQVRSNNSPPYKSGTYVTPDGIAMPINGDDIQLTPKAYWVSKKSNKRYPIRWELTLPTLDKIVVVTARFNHQELFNSVPVPFYYWEGQSLVTGSNTGNAYIEMVGY